MKLTWVWLGLLGSQFANADFGRIVECPETIQFALPEAKGPCRQISKSVVGIYLEETRTILELNQGAFASRAVPYESLVQKLDVTRLSEVFFNPEMRQWVVFGSEGRKNRNEVSIVPENFVPADVVLELISEKEDITRTTTFDGDRIFVAASDEKVIVLKNEILDRDALIRAGFENAFRTEFEHLYQGLPGVDILKKAERWHKACGDRQSCLEKRHWWYRNRLKFKYLCEGNQGARQLARNQSLPYVSYIYKQMADGCVNKPQNCGKLDPESFYYYTYDLDARVRYFSRGLLDLNWSLYYRYLVLGLI